MRASSEIESRGFCVDRNVRPLRRRGLITRFVGVSAVAVALLSGLSACGLIPSHDTFSTVSYNDDGTASQKRFDGDGKVTSLLTYSCTNSSGEPSRTVLTIYSQSADNPSQHNSRDYTNLSVCSDGKITAPELDGRNPVQSSNPS